MKKTAVVLIAALMLLGSTIPADAHAIISSAQRVYFSSTYSTYYWAMIWDYSLGYRESATSGFINDAAYLSYACQYWGVQVAYTYCYDCGRYVEALALRDVVL